MERPSFFIVKKQEVDHTAAHFNLCILKEILNWNVLCICSISPSDAGLGALHRTLIFHMLLAFVHCIGMTALKGSINLKHFHSGQ